jgi:hypothetical protein
MTIFLFIDCTAVLNCSWTLINILPSLRSAALLPSLFLLRIISNVLTNNYSWHLFSQNRNYYVIHIDVKALYFPPKVILYLIKHFTIFTSSRPHGLYMDTQYLYLCTFMLVIFLFSFLFLHCFCHIILLQSSSLFNIFSAKTCYSYKKLQWGGYFIIYCTESSW